MAAWVTFISIRFLNEVSCPLLGRTFKLSSLVPGNISIEGKVKEGLSVAHPLKPDILWSLFGKSSTFFMVYKTPASGSRA